MHPLRQPSHRAQQVVHVVGDVLGGIGDEGAEQYLRPRFGKAKFEQQHAACPHGEEQKDGPYLVESDDGQQKGEGERQQQRRKQAQREQAAAL